jgi:indole-3-glycerol phosphate synthase
LKDFVIDHQVYEGAAADAVLLIVAALEDARRPTCTA